MFVLLLLFPVLYQNCHQQNSQEAEEPVQNEDENVHFQLIRFSCNFNMYFSLKFITISILKVLFLQFSIVLF